MNMDMKLNPIHKFCPANQHNLVMFVSVRMFFVMSLGLIGSFGVSDLYESGLVRTCPHVYPHSSEYLLYLMENGSPSEMEGVYKETEASARNTNSVNPRYGFNSNQQGQSEVKSGFQSVQNQDIADKCINVPPCDRNARYRTINGSCNNLQFPMWGLSTTALVRLLPPSYSDGNNKAAKSKSGRELPNPRELRTKFLPNKDVFDRQIMLSLVYFGQFISHDFAHIVQQDTNFGGLDCCGSRPAMTLPKSCMQIRVPHNDSFYSKHNVKCLNFVRTMTTNNLGCNLKPQQQIAKVTHFCDVSPVYGSNDAKAKSLRTFIGGQLKVQLSSDNREFPPNSNSPEKDCDNLGDEKTCYNTGDDRANQNTGVTLWQILFLRQHNNLCRKLKRINPHWDDEKLYQEARRIVIAIYQRIIYDEWLPLVIGQEILDKFNLRDGQGNDDLSHKSYDAFLNPSTTNLMTTAAFRSFHSMVTSHMTLFDENQNPVETHRISPLFFRPGITMKPQKFDGFLRGLAWQEAHKLDRFYSMEITDRLFQSQKEFGLDLVSIDIQRGRDHGIPKYNDVREACGHSRAKDFSDFKNLMSNEAISNLKIAYNDIDDVDFYVGGLFENPAAGAIVGPTFQCIILEQFKRWRNGDRFFYEFGGQPGSLTKEQVIEIRKIKLSRLFCDNGDNITHMQPNVFLARSDENPVQSCNMIHTMDLSPWKEI